MLRTHNCGVLRSNNIGETVTLCGWVASYRDHGGVVFIDLRDRYGKTQVVFKPDGNLSEETHALARSLRSEYVIQATGQVVARPDNMVNNNLPTGEIDVQATELTVLNKSLTPAFEIEAPELPNEDLRLQHRYLDLRREPLQHAMKLRHRLSKATRDYFDEQEFLEIETPMLGRSTPEGARDYLVPSRIHEGCFYALPQSPQIYKQILMVSGFDRYFQIARCFRDEDLRADRQPEFTQIDVEMSFVERDDIFDLIDGLVSRVLSDVQGRKMELPLPRFSYHDVMERYGTDKPDLRFGMELKDIANVAANCEFGVFTTTIENGGRVRGVNAKAGADRFSRKSIDDMTDFVKEYGARGLAFTRVRDNALDTGIAKFFTPEQQQEIISTLEAESGDLLLFVADEPSVTSAALAALRNRLGKELELYDPNEFCALWVTDFPLFSWNEEENRWDAEHHPFCQPVDEDIPLLQTDPGKVRAQSYDLVVNGYEAASGSIRIHDPAVQQQVFDLLNVNAEEAEERFGFLLNALRYGAPPHGGVALGLDRWVMLLCGNDNIREVIAFPKTQRASDRLSGAPSEVDAHQLRDLHIRVDLPQPQN